jgi:hypothetical protein
MRIRAWPRGSITRVVGTGAGAARGRAAGDQRCETQHVEHALRGFGRFGTALAECPAHRVLLLQPSGSSANDLNVVNTSSACFCVDEKKLGRP